MAKHIYLLLALLNGIVEEEEIQFMVFCGGKGTHFFGSALFS